MNTAEVTRTLSAVVDPELGIDIVELGLVYGIAVDEGGNRVEVRMTMTSPGCPMGGVLIDGAVRAIQARFPSVRVVVTAESEPAWDMAMVGPAGRRRLGV